MFLLVFFNSLVGIINRVRLADYCWSSGLKVVGLNPCWLDALIVSRVPQIELTLPLGRSPRAALSIGIRFDQVSHEVYRCFPLFRLVLFQYLNSTKKALIFFPYPITSLCRCNFLFQFAFLNFSPSLCRCVCRV